MPRAVRLRTCKRVCSQLTVTSHGQSGCGIAGDDHSDMPMYCMVPPVTASVETPIGAHLKAGHV